MVFLPIWIFIYFTENKKSANTDRLNYIDFERPWLLVFRKYNFYLSLLALLEIFVDLSGNFIEKMGNYLPNFCHMDIIMLKFSMIPYKEFNFFCGINKY